MSPTNVLWMMLSLLVHLAIVIPALAGWIGKAPEQAPAHPSVQVRLLKRPTVPSPPAVPNPFPKPEIAHSNGPKLQKVNSAPINRPLQRLRRAESSQVAHSQSPSVPISPRPSSELPRTDSGSYPTVPAAKRFQAGNGRSGGRPADSEGGNAQPQPLGVGRAAVEIGPRIGRLPTNVPMPESLRKLSIARMEIKLEITVEIDGQAKVRLLESCGSSQLDRLLIDELTHTPWIPATLNGQPVAKSFRLTVQGTLHANTSSFSIVGLDSDA